MIEKRLEQFQINNFHGSNIILSRLPTGKVNLVIPEECIDRKQGKIDMSKIFTYLMSQNNVLIEYEAENNMEHESLEEYWKKNNIMTFVMNKSNLSKEIV